MPGYTLQTFKLCIFRQIFQKNADVFATIVLI